MWLNLPGNGQCIEEAELCNGVVNCGGTYPGIDDVPEFCCDYWYEKYKTKQLLTKQAPNGNKE